MCWPPFFFLDLGIHQGIHRLLSLNKYIWGTGDIQGISLYLWMISSKISTSLLQQSRTTLRWLTSKKWLWTVSTFPDDSPLNLTAHPISKIMGNQSKRCSRTSPWLSICHVGRGECGDFISLSVRPTHCRGSSGWNHEYCRQHLGEFTQVRKQSEGPSICATTAMANSAANVEMH